MNISLVGRYQLEQLVQRQSIFNPRPARLVRLHQAQLQEELVQRQSNLKPGPARIDQQLDLLQQPEQRYHLAQLVQYRSNFNLRVAGNGDHVQMAFRQEPVLMQIIVEQQQSHNHVKPALKTGNAQIGARVLVEPKQKHAII